jgi:hypothetical protein
MPVPKVPAGTLGKSLERGTSSAAAGRFCSMSPGRQESLPVLKNGILQMHDPVPLIQRAG